MNCDCPIGLFVAQQIDLLRHTQKAATATGCPIAFEQAAPGQFLPQGRTHQGKEPGETVAPWAEAGLEAQPQGVANVIKAETVRRLGINQIGHVTPRAKSFGLGFAPRGSCQLRHQMVEKQIAELPQNRKLAGGWLVSCLFIHAIPCGRAQTGKPTLFYPSTFKPVGLL
jgi:hypothetical protein